MSFRDLILFYLCRFLLTEEDSYLKRVKSLCRCFNLEYSEFSSLFPERKYVRLMNRLSDCSLLEEVRLGFPSDVMREIVKLRLYEFSKTIRPFFRFPKEMNGVAIINCRNIYIVNANDSLIDFLLQEFDPRFYTYSTTSNLTSVFGCKVLICGLPKVTFIAYLTSKIITNSEVEVVVTEKCIDLLMSNHQLLSKLFDSGHGSVNKVLKRIFYLLVGGHSP